MGVGSDRAYVDTIAGWCLKYISSYPEKSGGLPVKDDGSTNWEALYCGMTELLDHSVIRKVVDASYQGVLVDEYQDCGQSQHALICRLADLLRVRVFGDPLQAVFRFCGEPPDWQGEVEAQFPRLKTLGHPWRWCRTGENTALGEWLGEARCTLLNGEPLDLRKGQLTYLEGTGTDSHCVQQACFTTAKLKGSVAAISKWPEYRLVSQMTAGLYQCVEPIEAKDAAEFLFRLERASPKERVRQVLGFVKGISCHHGPAMRNIVAVLNGENCDAADPQDDVLVADLLRSVENGGPPAVLADALDALVTLKQIKVFRRELAWAVIDSLRNVGTPEYSNLTEALRRQRNRTSHMGRRLARYSSGSTLLLKGMEFDHAVVFHSAKLTINDVYVALTRASKSLTVVAPSPVIDPEELA